MMLDQNVLCFAAIHPQGRGSRKVVLPPKTSSETDVFAAAILDETTTHRKRPLDLAISLGLHAGVLAFILLLPLFFSSGLDLHKTTTTFLFARQSHVSGTVVIEALIDEHGNVAEARAVSGNALLIAAALKAVSERRYEPTILDGQPTPVALRVEVNFHG